MTIRQLSLRASHVDPDHAPPRRRAHLGMCLAAIALTIGSVAMAPSAMADSADSLRAAVAAARGTACGPLSSNPVVDQAAAAINETTDRWINQTSRAVPETDALPLLHDLGYGASKAVILSGAGQNDGNSIKGLLLEGLKSLPDCSYTDFGVSALYNAKKDMILTTAVLTAA